MSEGRDSPKDIVASPAKAEKPPTADRLLDVAAQLFREKGYAQATTRELAAMLGIQKASLYYHIENKEQLLTSICNISLERIVADVSAATSAAPPERRLRALINAHVSSALRDRDMHRTMLTELRFLSKRHLAEVIERRDAYEALVRRVIVESQEAGRLRSDISPKLQTMALLNLLNWTIFWFDPGGELQPHELADVLTTLFIEGSAPREPTAS